MSLGSPCDMHFVRSESLCAGALRQRCPEAHAIAQKSCLGNHDAVVNAKALVSGEHLSSPLLSHNAHHLLEPYVRSDTTDDQDFLAANVGHCSLGYLHKHGEDGFLEGEAQVSGGEVVFIGPIFSLRWVICAVALVCRVMAQGAFLCGG